MGLAEYHKKRKFGDTPEPEGRGSKKKEEKNPIFVVHEHNASHLHWDFRLEHEEVLVSWALPKGPPKEMGEKRLAVQVEDHPYEYKDFEGDIPKGQYGAGHVDIWDRGTYEIIKWDSSIVEIVMNGKKMKGRYSLIKTHGYGKKSWILMRQKPKS